MPCPIKGRALLPPAHCARVRRLSLAPCPNRRARPLVFSVVVARAPPRGRPAAVGRAPSACIPLSSLSLVLARAPAIAYATRPRRRRTTRSLRARQRCGRGAVARAPRRTPSGTQPRAPPPAVHPEPRPRAPEPPWDRPCLVPKRFYKIF